MRFRNAHFDMAVPGRVASTMRRTSRRSLPSALARSRCSTGGPQPSAGWSTPSSGRAGIRLSAPCHAGRATCARSAPAAPRGRGRHGARRGTGGAGVGGPRRATSPARSRSASSGRHATAGRARQGAAADGRSELTRAVPAFCTHCSGPERTQMSNRQGADAHRDATSGQIVGFQGPGATALDQVILGSNPRGATRSAMRVGRIPAFTSTHPTLLPRIFAASRPPFLSGRSFARPEDAVNGGP